jgi:hypothetical protein
MANAKRPKNGINKFFISRTEYSTMPINRAAKKKIENELNKVARQIQRVASKTFFLIFVLFFKLIIRRSERSIKRLAINVEVYSKLCGKTPKNKQKNSAAKLLLCVKLFLVTIKITVKRDAIKTRRYKLSFK